MDGVLADESGRRRQRTETDRKRAQKIKRENPDLTYEQIASRLGRSAKCVHGWCKETT
jgi:hypothetical protein